MSDIQRKRYAVGYGKSISKEFDTAAELNAWYKVQDAEEQYSCVLYDNDKNLKVFGRDYMWFNRYERWSD